MTRISRPISTDGTRSRRQAVRAVGALLATGIAVGGLLLSSPQAQASSRTEAAVSVSAGSCQRTLGVYPVLRPGDRGPAVAALQCLINDSGRGPLLVDGWYGPQTKAVVVPLTAGEGQPDYSGRVGRSFWTSVISLSLSDRTLRNGSTGADVVTLQRALRAQGCTIVVDGWFGPQTESVVKDFQRASVNVVDGVVGPSTRFTLTMGGTTDWNCR